MSRFAALLLSLLLVTAPLSALAGDDDASASGTAADIQGYISAITGVSTRTPTVVTKLTT